MNRMNRLTQLIQANRKAPRAYKAETSGDEATLFLYDVIGYDWWSDGGITAKDFAKDLQAFEASGVKTLNLRINSPGGDVFEGRAIVAAMQRSGMHLVAHIDGLAASAASFIAVHAHEVKITDGAFMMIHNGWTMAVGDRHSMLETAALLEKIDASIVDDYAKKSGMDKAVLASLMDAETWFTAAECVANNLADCIAEPTSSKAKACANAWNLDAYENAPFALAAIAKPAEPITNPEHDHLHAARHRALQLIESTAA